MESVIGPGWILCFCSVLPLACQTSDRAADRAADRTANQTPDPAAAQLASRIASLLPRRTTVSIETRSLAQLPPPEWSKFPSRFQDELRKAGVQISGGLAAAVSTATTPPEARVRVTLSEDTDGLLLVAEVVTGVGDKRQIAILPWNVPPSGQPNPQVSITKKLLWGQEDPILDVLLAHSDSQMLILSVNSIASYRLTDGKWTAISAASLALPRPMPRDPRGRLELTPAGFRAYLPDGTCDGALQPKASQPELTLTCSSDIASWQDAPVRWAPDRNVLQPETASPSFEGWGSDTAGISDPCGSGQAVIADSPNNEHDSVRAYQIVDGQATPMSDPVPLPGPVTALWPEPSGREAIVVVHNLQTGEYEASRLGVACTQ